VGATGGAQWGLWSTGGARQGQGQGSGLRGAEGTVAALPGGLGWAEPAAPERVLSGSSAYGRAEPLYGGQDGAAGISL